MPQTAAELEKLPGAQKPLSGGMSGDQPLTVDEQMLVREAYKFLKIFKDGCREYHDKVRDTAIFLRKCRHLGCHFRLQFC